MDYINYRKHPRIYKKNVPEEEEERFFDLSIAAAAGILALVFAKGMLCGYLIKRHMG